MNSYYTPKSEEQIAKEGLFAKGVYDVEVAEASDSTSKKSGNPMIVLKLNVFNDVGEMRTVFDYITFGSNFGERKFRHAATCFGLMEKYNAGDLKGGDFLNQMGKAEIGQSKPTDEYPLPKNIVIDYVGREEATAIQEKESKNRKPNTAAELNDGIPF